MCIQLYDMLIYQIVDTLEKRGVKYALVGGYALALHGIVRATMDVDFVIKLRQKDYQLAEEALGEIGLQSRLPISAHDVIKMRKEYIKNRNLMAWSFVDYQDPSRQADILITLDLKDIKIKRISVAGRKIAVASLEDLLKMKLAAGRSQDIADVDRIRGKINEKKTR